MRITVSGIDDVILALERIPDSVKKSDALAGAADIFAARLRAATPTGYSGRLRDSVIFDANDEEASVGYDREVETAGNTDLDSVTRPQIRGRSVLRWVSADELGAVLAETFDAYADEGVTYMERRLADGIS